ncbi:hypothetical protein [Streptomyces sp. KL116D]|uniref:hypothetical protein n=1 Tax=Streptomyces sp. KL116D TaxID=3045152 RepID=UPI0035568E58
MGVAVLAGVAARAARRAGGARIGGGARWAGAVVAWPGTLVTDTARLVAAVVRTLRGRPVEGTFRTVRLAPGVGNAWACVLLSASPGACVVGGDDREVRTHVLVDEPSALERALR